MEFLQLIVTFFTEGFMADLLGWLGGLLAFWGLADLYMFYRFGRGEGVDKTAALWNWFSVKWSLASQTKLMAEKLPFISQDLSEVIGLKDDDGRIT